MPMYEFRCQACATEFSLFYKSRATYEQDADRRCPQCQSAALDRLIRQVNFRAMSREYGRMSSQEMLSVLESGDSRQVSELYRQVKGTDPARALPVHEKAKSALDAAEAERKSRRTNRSP
ncbi:MAG: zinc ribbon domain-containing protein [Anaerolineae bacterium]|nr:zinc ribbon domain-containing protein [Anaerolineae bacterium]MDW8172916.1 zinc ribbon domain-containing protein [Anaerolineae bacterium]